MLANWRSSIGDSLRSMLLEGLLVQGELGKDFRGVVRHLLSGLLCFFSLVVTAFMHRISR